MFFLRYILPAVAAAPFAAAASCSGPLTIQNSGDASPLAACQTYSGSITIATQAANQVRIDTVQEIDGDLNVVSANNLGSVAADSLTTISGTFKLQGVRQLTEVDFPKLTDVGAIDWKTLPALNGLSFGAGISTIKTVSILDTQLQDLKGISPTEIDSFTAQSNGILTNVSFDLGTVNDQFIVSSNGANMALSLSNLTEAKTMVLQGLGSVDLSQLQTVGGAFDVEDASFETFEAPKLQEVQDTLTIQKNDALSQIKMPVLKNCVGGFVIAANPKLLTIDGLPALQNIRANLDFTGAFDEVDLPQLKNVQGDFNIQTSKNTSKICPQFDNEHGKDLPIRGKYTCQSSTNPTSIGGGNGGNSSDDSNSGNGTDFGISLNIPRGTYVAFAGGLAAIFGMF